MAAAETLMWEVRCDAGTSKALVEWISTEVMPLFWDDEAVALWNVYRSVGQDGGDRVVLVVDYVGRASSAAPLPVPPPELVARPAHQWVFERLDL